MGNTSRNVRRIFVCGTLLLCGTARGYWWNDFPRIVSDSSAQQISVVSNYHGTINMNGNGQDPSWGTFFQKDGLVRSASKIAAVQAAGLKQIGYFETYGTTYCPVAELGVWDGVNLTPILHTHWSWSLYAGGTVRWLGVKNFFDNEDFARPYTRTHPRYGGLPMTYPDGTTATGYNGTSIDPRNSRVYDAGCSKDILGNLSVAYTDTTGPTNGLIINPETSNYASFIMLKKDAACPLWNSYTYASALQAADAGINGMWTDNYGPWDSLGSTPVKLAFGDWSVARFRSYLTNRFDAATLNNMGVADAATFDIRAYLKTVATGWGWNGSNLDSTIWDLPGWAENSLWRAYLIFKRQTGTEALSNYYAAVKSAALASTNTEFLVSGNDIPGFSLGWCRGDLDMVGSELALGFKTSNGSTGFTPPPVGRYAPFYKLAREHAQSRFVNVWLYNDRYTNELSHVELCKVLYYEMLATHTLPKFDPSNSRIAGDEATNVGFFDFVARVALQYKDRLPVEDIGIYYSSSSILRQLTPGGFINPNAQPHQFGFWGWATALGELHFQYRAVPEWKLTTNLLSTLRLLVIPNADVLDPVDASQVLEPWLNNGGRLIITGDSGKYLGESGNFDLNTNGWSVASLTNHANVIYLPDNIGMDYYLAYSGRPALLSQFASVMGSALTGAVPAGITATTVAGQTGLTLYEDSTAGRFFIDVNNFDINPTSYSITGTGPLSVEAVLPPWLRKERLQVSVVTPQTNPPTTALVLPAEDRVQLSLGSVDYYAGIIIEKEAQWANWQLAHFTTEEINAGLARTDADPDGDHYTNEQEFVAGTDPRDVRSVCSLSYYPAGSNLSGISFSTVSGRFYSIESRTNLMSGNWSVEMLPVAGDGQLFSTNLAGGDLQNFYRLTVGLP